MLRTPFLLAAVGVPALLLLWIPAVTAEMITPVNDVEAAWVLSSGETKEYFLVSGADPVDLKIKGSGTLKIYFRAHYPQKTGEVTRVSARIAGVKTKDAKIQVEVKRSSSSQYDDDRGGRPSGGGKVVWEIPKGDHLASVSASSSSGEPVYAIFYYTPDVPEVPPGKWVVGPIGIKASAYLGFVYDDNPIHYSDEDLLAFRGGENPDKFLIATYDDLILNPWIRFDFSLPPLVGFRERARLTFKFNDWRYTSNHVKNNRSLYFLLRQPVRKSDYVEVFYQYNPQQYIRSFRWRHPYVSKYSADYEYTKFNYTRNEMFVGYRYGMNRTWAFKASIRRLWKYYNQPFMDNDLWVWAYRLQTDIRISRGWRAMFRYQYENVDSRGYDSLGETKETSDDSNSDHYVDEYRLQLRYYPPKTWGRWHGPTRIEWEFQRELSWYTSEKPIEDDPFHVGRKDKQWAAEMTLYFPFIGPTTMEAGYKWSQRKVESPYEGEFIGDEKDYTSNRMWVGFEVPL